MMKTTTAQNTPPTDWVISDKPVDYDAAVCFMEARVAAIDAGEAGELVWLLEHPPLYTAGTSAKPADLLAPERFPVYTSGRGGQYTYHGPGQRVVYVMLDLTRRGRDVRAFVSALENWVIETLRLFNIHGETRQSRVGVWVVRSERGLAREDKIAALGIRLRKWISLHGLSINVDPDLSHFDGIRPCGISGHGVTSLADLGHPVSMSALDRALMTSFEARFGPLRELQREDLAGLP